MSALAAAAETCPSCDAVVPRDARFCPACGAPVGAGATLKAEVPAEEVGPVPVSMQRAEAHMFGVAPPGPLLAAAAIAGVVAVVLFAVGKWPFGLIVVGVCALLLAAFLEVVRRRPPPAVARASRDVRGRARSSWETLRARQTATVESRRIQGQLLALDSERRSALHDLGVAAHAREVEAEAAAHARLDGLDEREVQLRAALDAVLAEAGESIRRARLPVEETVLVLPTEPAPPPDEADPPEPAVVPEPYPPPDEGTPPEPARIPEPGPDEG
jgi:hypothetical protein